MIAAAPLEALRKTAPRSPTGSMTPREDQSFVARNPVTTLVVLALVSGVVGLALVLTAVGAIVGIPLLVVSLVAGIAATRQYHKRSSGESDTIPEADRRRA
jgi:hypothetical protein